MWLGVGVGDLCFFGEYGMFFVLFLFLVLFCLGSVFFRRELVVILCKGEDVIWVESGICSFSAFGGHLFLHSVF